MKTLIVDPKSYIDKAAELILKGELVVFPTETVYGLGADAFNPDAVEKIFEAKGRPQDNPLIVHISRTEQVESVAKDIPKAFYTLAQRFMPGPLTVILPKGDKIPYTVTAGGDTVGVRMPDNVWARALISASRPLAAPSANISKHISPTTALHVYEDLNGRVPIILDGGACRVGIESTVLDLTAEIPTILRPGAITADMLAPILGEVTASGTVIKTAKSPGMKYQHYAPGVPTFTAQEMLRAIAEYDKFAAEGLRPVIIAREVSCGMLGNRAHISVGSTGEEFANRIYAALHDAEKCYDRIIVEELGDSGIENSVMNRVFKAAGGHRV